MASLSAARRNPRARRPSVPEVCLDRTFSGEDARRRRPPPIRRHGSPPRHVSRRGTGSRRPRSSRVHLRRSGRSRSTATPPSCSKRRAGRRSLKSGWKGAGLYVAHRQRVLTQRRGGSGGLRSTTSPPCQVVPQWNRAWPRRHELVSPPVGKSPRATCSWTRPIAANPVAGFDEVRIRFSCPPLRRAPRAHGEKR